MTWQDRAACRGRAVMGDPSPEGVRDSLYLCNGDPQEQTGVCPVRKECGRWVRSEQSFDGVAAGEYWVNGSVKKPPKVATFGPVSVTQDLALRAAHAAYARGDRDPGVIELEREYQRMRKQRNRGSLRPETLPAHCVDCSRPMRVGVSPGGGEESVRHLGRGLCVTCHRRHTRKGTIDTFPHLARSPRTKRGEEYDFLVSQGLTRDEVAGQLGMKPDALRKMLQRRSHRAA